MAFTWHIERRVYVPLIRYGRSKRRWRWAGLRIGLKSGKGWREHGGGEWHGIGSQRGRD